MSKITTHILDISIGKPAANVKVEIKKQVTEDSWQLLDKSSTNQDGRISDWLKKQGIQKGIYSLTFHTKSYFDKHQRSTFFPYVVLVFEIHNLDEHYHVPLLLSSFGYSTYRGS